MFSINDIKRLLGMGNFKVLVGSKSVLPGDYDFKDGTATSLVVQPPVVLNLFTSLQDIKQETEHDSKNFILAAGGAVLGAMLLGPLVAIFAFIGLGNSHKVCAVITLKTGEQFLAIINTDVYSELLAIRLANS